MSSGEYLNYAMKNRQEWEARGEEVVAGMIKEAREKYGVKGNVKMEQVQQGLLCPGKKMGYEKMGVEKMGVEKMGVEKMGIATEVWV